METVYIKNVKPKISAIEFIFLIFFSAYYILPAVSSAINFIPMLAVAFLYVLLTLKSTPQDVIKKMFSVIAVAAFVALCYYLFTETSTISKNASYYELKRYLSRFQQIIFGFFPLLMIYRAKFYGTLKQKKILIYAVFAMFIFVIITTSRQLNVDANATRGWENFGELATGNVGTYGFVYAVSALIPAVIILWCTLKNSTARLAAALGILFMLWFLLRAQYTLAVLIAAISFIVYVFVVGKSRISKVIIVLALPVLFMLLPPILNGIAGVLGSEQMAIRFTELANAFSGEEIGYNLGSRLELYKNSLKYFFYSPFWGNRVLNFDGHATLLTVLSDIGLIGAIPYFWLYHNGRKTVSLLCETEEDYKKFVPVFVSFVLMGLTNPIHATLPLYIVVWFLTPLIIDVFCREGEEQREDQEESVKIRRPSWIKAR